MWLSTIAPKVGKYNVHSIEATAFPALGPPAPRSTKRSSKELTGGKLVEGYGLTEASPVTHCNPVYGKLQDRHDWSAFLWARIPRLMDVETGKKEPEGEGDWGNWSFKGPQVMQGYLEPA